VYKVLEHSNHRSDELESSKRQNSGIANEDHHVERIYLSKEAIARVKDVVKRGKLLPENATQDELRAYNKLASELTKQTREQRLELEKQEKAAIKQKNNHKPPARSDSPDHDSPVRVKSKFSNLRHTDRKRVARKLDDDFKLEEDDDEEQLTPAEALKVSESIYLVLRRAGRVG
jgi:septal ring factor EnvC (AmiA/AmiB activator)